MKLRVYYNKTDYVINLTSQTLTGYYKGRVLHKFKLNSSAAKALLPALMVKAYKENKNFGYTVAYATHKNEFYYGKGGLFRYNKTEDTSYRLSPNTKHTAQVLATMIRKQIDA